MSLWLDIDSTQSYEIQWDRGEAGLRQQIQQWMTRGDIAPITLTKRQDGDGQLARREDSRGDRGVNEYAGHHRHLIGARIVCSCGEHLGLVTTSREPSPSDVCEICRATGVLAAEAPRSAFRLPEAEAVRLAMPLLTAEEAARLAVTKRATCDDLGHGRTE